MPNVTYGSQRSVDDRRGYDQRGYDQRGTDGRYGAYGSRDYGNRNSTERGGYRGNDGYRANDSRYRGGNESRYRDGDRGRGSWNRSWREDSRYDWRSYRENYSDRYRIGRYYSPYSNYGYRRYGIGAALLPLFYSERYWINDPYAYRLPEAYGEYRWVRYYNDALLVDIYTGQVIDEIDNFFF